jgi:hypothetical protein
VRLRGRFRRRTLVLAIASLSLASAYVGSYYRISRMGMHESSVYGLAGFLYVPFERAAAMEDLSRHHCLAAFYAPANWVDRQLFGAEAPVDCIIWRLSG